MSDAPQSPPPSAPGLLCAAALLCAAVLVTPELVGRFMSLDWHIGPMHGKLRVLQIVLGVCAVLAFLARRPIGRLYRRIFPTRKLLIFKCVAATMSFAIGLVLLEFALRAVGYPFDSSWTPSEFAIAEFDDELGWRYQKDVRTEQAFGTPERRVALRFSALGTRVGEAHGSYDFDAPTVLFVGGSYTMGHGVTYDESFVGRLDADGGFPYQVVNLGVQGYGTDQALLSLRRHLPRFRDVRAVVYTFIADHIERNANTDRRLLFRRGRFLGTKPRFALREGGRLELTDTPYRFKDRGTCHIWSTWLVYAQARGPRAPLDLTAALIREIGREATARGAAFATVHWRQSRPATERGVTLFDRYFPRGDGVPIIDTGANAPDGWKDWIIPGDDHPTAAAHEHVARLIRDRWPAIIGGATK